MIRLTNRRKTNELASQQFYKFDKWILAEKKLKKLSANAKLLYMVLRDREELSLKNAKVFTDEEGCLFQYFDQIKASELLGISKNAIIKAFKDLQEYNLIESVRQGQGKPNRLYILNFEVSDDTLKELSYENKKDLPAGTDKPNKKTDNKIIDTDSIPQNEKKDTKKINENYTNKQKNILSLLNSRGIEDVKIEEALNIFTDIDKLEKCIDKCIEYNKKNFNYLKAVYEDKKKCSNNSNNKFNNFNPTFTEYTEDELNEIIEKSQKAKFGDSDSKNNSEVGTYGEEY